MLDHGVALPVQMHDACSSWAARSFHACQYRLNRLAAVWYNICSNEFGLLFTYILGAMSFAVEIVAVANSFGRLVSEYSKLPEVETAIMYVFQDVVFTTSSSRPNGLLYCL